MKKNIRRPIVAAFILAFQAVDGYAQTASGMDSSLSLDRIESAIAFLEDGRKVAALTQQLKLLAEAKRAVESGLPGSVSPMQPERTERSERTERTERTFNLFQTIKKISMDGKTFFEEMALEGRRVVDRAVSVQAGQPGQLLWEQLLSLMIMILIAVVIGGFVAVAIWRAGRRLRESVAADKDRVKRVQGTAAIIAARSAVGIGGSLSFVIISLFPSVPAMQQFFSSMAAGYLLYTAATVVLVTLFSPNNSRLRSIACSDPAALQITRQCTTLLRLSLLMYLFHRGAIAMNLPVTDRFFTWGYQMIMTVMVPCTLYRLRPYYLEPFRNFYQKRIKGRILFQLVDHFLSKLHLIALLYAITLIGISITGTEATHRFFIGGTVKTAIFFLAGGFLFIVWHKFLHWLTNVQKSLLSHNEELRSRISGNIKIIGSTGYIVISGAILYCLVKTWGMHLGGLLQSEAPFVQTSSRVFAIVVGAWILLQAALYLIGRFQHAARNRMILGEQADSGEIEKRVFTLGGIFRKIITVSIVVIGAIMIMDELGFDIKAMVAGVGIVGIAVGFGAQNLVRDVISGLFVIFENRIRVGDVAIINGTAGLVEQVNLRTSILRGEDGTIHVFPNGAITSLSNMTHEYSYYVFEIGVAYKEDTDRVEGVLGAIGKEIADDPQYRPFILQPLEIMGVDAFADSAVMIKARIKTSPVKQWFVGREINRRIKKRFDELGIEIPFPHRTICFGEGGKPVVPGNASMQEGRSVPPEIR